MAKTGGASRRFVDLVVGGRVATRRRKLGLNTAVFAESLGMTEFTLVACETGRTNFLPSQLFQAACILGVRPGWFFESLEVDVVAVTDSDPSDI